jgi:DNA recombination protein RmuC
LAVLLAGTLVALIWLVGRGSGARDSATQRQLGEVRARLDQLVLAQSELPTAVAEGAAEQARSLADVRERLGRLSEATVRLEALGRSVADVQELLKVPRLRGTLGEVWLEELLRQVFPTRLYEMQYAFRTGERVDAVLRVGTRLVPIDSKFPLEACQRMLAAEGETAARERRRFRRSLKERIDEIAEKYIRPEEGTLDFALMYIPAEAVYYEAVVRDEALEDQESIVGYALRRHVIPVSPHTFYAYVSAVLHGLRGLDVEERAREIETALGALRHQFDRFQRAFALVGRHLDNALKQYQESERQWFRVQERLDVATGFEADARGPGAAGLAEGDVAGELAASKQPASPE